MTGKKAPAFCLPDQNGENVCLKNLKGQWVILYFYPKDNTPGCTTEACQFTAARPGFSRLDATVLGISPDSTESHKKFEQSQDLKVILLADPDKKALEAYGVWQLKKNYGKEYYGVVRTTFLIDPDGRVAHVWKKVKADGHAEKVREKLEALKG